MTARQMFKVGDKVRLTELAKKDRVQCWIGRSRGSRRGERPTFTGVVVGFGEASTALRVQPDGRRTATTYFMGHWELIDQDAAKKRNPEASEDAAAL